ncbi:FACT complex subunit SSRP1, partial [Haematococcus lacustris]
YVALARTSSATFDLLLHLTGGEVLEFGHLDKSELGRIQTYLTQARLADFDPEQPDSAEKPRPAKRSRTGGELSEEEAANSEARAAGKAASASGAGSSRPGALANGTDENDDDDSDSDDEDFDPEQPDSAEKPRPAKRSRTGGEVVAQRKPQACDEEDIGEDDDDDDEDEDEEDDEYETDDDEDGTADTGTPSRPSRGGEVAEDSDEGEDEDEDERGEEAGEADDDDDDSDLSVEDEDGICAANLTELIEKDKEEDKKAARQRAGKPSRI